MAGRLPTELKREVLRAPAAFRGDFIPPALTGLDAYFFFWGGGGQQHGKRREKVFWVFFFLNVLVARVSPSAGGGFVGVIKAVLLMFRAFER